MKKLTHIEKIHICAVVVKAKAEDRNADKMKHLQIIEALLTANGGETSISERKLHVTVFRGVNALRSSSQFTSKLALTQPMNHFLHH